MTANKIDQAKRRELCERIVNGEQAAVVALADLYRSAGLSTMAKTIESSFTAAQRHARTILQA